jgi:hypothetical protein
MRGASNFDVRTVTIEGLTSVRYLLSATVGIVTVIVTIWSPGLSWSHNTLHFDKRLNCYPVEGVSERLGGGIRRCRAALLYSGQLFRAGTLDGVALTSNSFFAATPDEAGLVGAVSLFKPRRIKHLVAAAITELVVPTCLAAPPLKNGFDDHQRGGLGPHARSPGRRRSLIGDDVPVIDDVAMLAIGMQPTAAQRHQRGRAAPPRRWNS